MTEERDVYWDNCGIAWKAIKPGPDVAVHLQERMRWQTLLTTAVLLGGVPLGLAGIAVGVWTIWLGITTRAWNFVSRGGAIVVISALVIAAAWSFRNALKAKTETVQAMIDLALARAEKWDRAIWLGYVACAVAAVLGLIGYGIRVYLGKPPAMSPIEPLAILAALGFVLFLFHRGVSVSLAKYRYLKRLLQD